MRLLLVEDDPSDVLFMKKAVDRVRAGLPLLVAHDGDAAVEVLLRERPSHVLLDLKLPKRSGLEVLEWIRGREDLVGLPVVVLTSSMEKPDLQRARELGVDAYRVKPVSFPELVAMLKEILSAWKLT